MVWRNFNFLFLYLLCLSCDNGMEIRADSKFENLPISYDYIEYELGHIPVDNQPGVRQEFEWQRNLHIVRSSSIREVNLRRSTTIKKPTGFREGLRRAVTRHLNFAAGQVGFCPICSLDFIPEDVIIHLPCHTSHIMHEHCFVQLMEFTNKEHKTLLCPSCRQPVDQSKVTFSEKRPDSPKKEYEDFPGAEQPDRPSDA